MCWLFPSSLGEVALWWFNQLDKRTIASWIQMAEAFMARFITNCWRTKEMDALLTLKLEEGESIKDYTTRFWETYNDINNYSENVAVRTFKSGLPLGTGLRQLLTKRLATTLRKLMDRIKQFIRVEEDGGNTASKQMATQPKIMILKPPTRTNNSAKDLRLRQILSLLPFECSRRFSRNRFTKSWIKLRVNLILFGHPSCSATRHQGIRNCNVHITGIKGIWLRIATCWRLIWNSLLQ